MHAIIMVAFTYVQQEHRAWSSQYRNVTGCSKEVAHLLGRHLAAEDSGGGEVAAVAGVGSAHHVL